MTQAGRWAVDDEVGTKRIPLATVRQNPKTKRWLVMVLNPTNYYRALADFALWDNAISVAHHQAGLIAKRRARARERALEESTLPPLGLEIK